MHLSVCLVALCNSLFDIALHSLGLLAGCLGSIVDPRLYTVRIPGHSRVIPQQKLV